MVVVRDAHTSTGLIMPTLDGFSGILIDKGLFLCVWDLLCLNPNVKVSDVVTQCTLYSHCLSCLSDVVIMLCMCS